MSDLRPVALRAATEADLEDLVDLTTAFYEEDGFSATTAALRERFTAFLRSRDADVTVAVTPVTPVTVVGFALTTVRSVLESGQVAEVQDLYVRPEHRRKGVGTELVRHAAQWARDSGADLLEVVIAPNGREVGHLRRYYGSLGFRDEGRRILVREP